MVMLPFLKKSHKDSNKFLCLEINSSFVKCLAFYQEENKCKIIGSGKQRLEYGSVRGGVILDPHDVEEAIRISVAQATKNLEEDITQVIVGVNGDLCLGITTTIRLKRPADDIITKRETDTLYKRLVEAAYMQIQNDYLDVTGNPDADLEIITTSNVYLKVNNQVVDSLEEKPGSTVEAAVFNAFCPKYHIETIEDILKKSDLNLIAIGYDSYATAQQLKYASLENNDYVIINVTNDSTDVAVVFGKGIIATKSLCVGYGHFIENISEKMGLTLIEAEKVLNAHIEEKLTSGESAIVHTCLLETLDIWITGLELLFGEFKGVRTFAPKIYITGSGTHIPTLTEMVKNEPWMKSIPFKAPPEFKQLDFMTLEKVTDATGNVNSSEWLTPAVLSIIFTEITNIKYD
jgi:cell division ATPase FtsA